MRPTIGRVVHYTSNHNGGPSIQAALITAVEFLGELEDKSFGAPFTENDFVVSLRVFYADGESNRHKVEFTSAGAGTAAAVGMWSWPARDV